MPAKRYDVAVVGGGPAGLSAALWLARYLHKVVVVDSGDPRNWETRGINGYLGHQGIRSPELRAIGRSECAEYGVDFVGGIVDEAINETGELFAICLRGGTTIQAPRILLAIGLKDVWPNIPGLDQCYGETALSTWTRQIVICTNGEPPDMDQELLDQLKTLNIPVLDGPIRCVVSKDREISGIELEDGMSLDCERLYFAIGQYPSDDLGAQLGCKRDQLGRLVIDEYNHTSVKNVYAAGDIAHAPQLAIVAASSGAVAAMAIHASLIPEGRKLTS